MKINNYIVAAIGHWNQGAFEEKSNLISGNWFFAATPDDLSNLLTSGISPKYIFFLHWRWIVPKIITDEYECVCFHMTDVPFGRGGSPLQNLIVRGYRDTVLTALQMNDGLDAGPVYMKKPFSLEGSAREIYERVTNLSWDMIPQIISNQPIPEKQVGNVTEFKRRVAEDSEIPSLLSLEKIYDYIRMLDADGYPKAFLDVNGYKLIFEDAKLNNDELTASVTIKLRDELL